MKLGDAFVILLLSTNIFLPFVFDFCPPWQNALGWFLAIILYSSK